MNPNQEPVSYGGILTAVAVALIPFLRSVGVHISQDQADSGLALLAALVVAGTFLVRSKVTPTDKAQTLINTAAAAPAGSPPPKL